MSDTQPHDLHTFMEQVTREIASEYKRIYTRAAEDPGTAGDEGEENGEPFFVIGCHQTIMLSQKVV